MTCCDWETFSDSFLSVWRKSKHKPSEVLIDWKSARKYWNRHHCTGGEAARIQLSEVMKGGEYLWMANSNNRNDGEGGMKIKHTPVVV